MHALRGIEWIVEAHGCPPDRLRSLAVLQDLFARIVADMHLRPVGTAQWHQFPVSGGITGLCLLSESHLTCHTFPEYGSVCLNVFCCRPRDPWDFDGNLKSLLAAERVSVRSLEREYVPAAAKAGAAT